MITLTLVMAWMDAWGDEDGSGALDNRGCGRDPEGVAGPDPEGAEGVGTADVRAYGVLDLAELTESDGRNGEAGAVPE